jgi:hypothetical protein
MSLTTNTLVLSSISILVTAFAEKSPYWQFGYNDNLILISVKINTFEKYVSLLLLIAVINWSKVIIDNVALPILSFSIYNPDKKVITDFTKNELHIFGNAVYFVANVRRLLLVLISVSQFDLAIWSILISQLSSAYIIYTLLREKTFNLKRYEAVATNNDHITLTINN